MSLITTLFSVTVCLAACSFCTFPYVLSDVVCVRKYFSFGFSSLLWMVFVRFRKSSLHIVERRAGFTFHLQEIEVLVCLYVTSQTSYFRCLVSFGKFVSMFSNNVLTVIFCLYLSKEYCNSIV